MKIKKMPNEITILGRKYDLIVMSQEQIQKISNVENAIASVENGTQTILLWDNDPDILGSLIHEIMHVVQYVTGIDQIIGPDMQEIFCESTANGIKDLLREIDIEKTPKTAKKRAKKNRK